MRKGRITVLDQVFGRTAYGEGYITVTGTSVRVASIDDGKTARLRYFELMYEDTTVWWREVKKKTSQKEEGKKMVPGRRMHHTYSFPPKYNIL